MKKKLDCRFPAPRIKKIMQADEDIGKMALTVPLLMSKALELFLQELCDRTYGISLKTGAKTLTSLHLKQCVKSFDIYDFLGEIVGKVPDLGGSEAAGNDQSVAKRRKVADDDYNVSDEGVNGCRMHETTLASSIGGGSGSGRGGGRGRGRGRVRSCRIVDRAAVRERAVQDKEFKNDLNFGLDDAKLPMLGTLDHLYAPRVFEEKFSVRKTTQAKVRDFDLNVELDENGEAITTLPTGSISSLEKGFYEVKHEELPRWLSIGNQKMVIDPKQSANLNGRTYEVEEDYDEED